jgi:hypothetical protein
MKLIKTAYGKGQRGPTGATSDGTEVKGRRSRKSNVTDENDGASRGAMLLSA